MKLRLPSAYVDRDDPDHPHGRTERGQSLVELAIFAPILLLVLLVTVDLGRVYLGWVSLNNVARIGANFAAQTPDSWQGTGDPTAQARYRQLMAKDATEINCKLPNPLPGPVFPDAAPNTYAIGSRVRVDIDCRFPLLTPFLSNIIGDGSGNVAVRSSATFTIRYGSPPAGSIGGSGPAATPPPTPAPATPVPPTLPPGATPDPSASPTPDPPAISFYGTPTSTDSYGGGAPGSAGEGQIVGIPALGVRFSNTTSGSMTSCLWDFGDGVASTSCAASVGHVYFNRGLYNVSLTIDGYTLTRTSYVLVGCKVPAFSGVRVNSAPSQWTDAGFQVGNFIAQADGNGNYKIAYQSLAGGLVNPPGGCSSAVIEVGP